MSQLSPCPQCRTKRVWARATFGSYGILHVAYCPACARASAICQRCGTELALTRAPGWVPASDPPGEPVLRCPACRGPAALRAQPAGAGVASPFGGAGGAAAATPTVVHRRQIAAFASDAAAPPMMQRVADDFEDLASLRYRRRRKILGVVEDAARRADAMARLELELGRLQGWDTAA
jgi:DNA-directed RNA polymerase subunit RPC12/RpoP